jgi:segregation and condensation protein A
MSSAKGHDYQVDLWPDGEGPVRLMPEPDEDATPLVVDLDGFAGPLDLLLQLARTQKVDITRISILALAEQYLVFIEDARRMKLELAADYLVMAAWLAYLKSRLLLPKEDHGDDEPPPEELAARLQFRLQRLQAMRDAAAKLMSRNRLGRDVFQRGWPEPVVMDKQTEWGDTLIDLLQAYAQRRQRSVAHRTYEIRRQPVWTLKEARIALERMLGQMDDWGRFDTYLVQYFVEPEKRRSVIASGFTASLELAREGVLEVRQEKHFEPIYIRRARAG